MLDGVYRACTFERNCTNMGGTADIAELAKMKSLLRYFDLNVRAADVALNDRGVSENDMLQAAGRARRGRGDTAMPWWEQILMYLGIAIGVFFSSAVTQFKTSAPKSITFTVGTIAVSLVIAFVVVPVAFERLQLKSSSPFIVRFALFVQNGVFWNVLFAAAGKALGT